MLPAGKFHKLVFFIKRDLYRHTGSLTFRNFIKTYFFSPGFNFMVWHRIKTFYDFRFLGLVLLRKRVKFGIDIPAITIGQGFYIGHFGGIVVSGQAVIGKNCNISQGVTIGGIYTGPNKGVPSIGNSVYIGPGAKIIGNINIGNNVAIGANSVVAKDVPDNAVVVGIPARVVSYEGSSGYIQKIFVG